MKAPLFCLAQVKKETKKTSLTSASSSTTDSSAKGIRQDIDGEDDEESYYRYMEENPNAGRWDIYAFLATFMLFFCLVSS